MKKYFSFALFSLAALLFTACTNEEDVNNGTEKPDPKGTIGFSFPMSKEGVIYARTIADGTVGVANPNESLVKGVRIYMFNTGDGKLIDWQSFSVENMTANDGKALFNVTGKSGACTFYAVANAEWHLSEASLKSLIKGASTLDDFQALISNNTGKTHLTAEADKGLLMTGFRDIDDILAPTAAEKIINLKRRVARFDVVNNETDGTVENLGGTNFQIMAIYVSNANYAGYLTAEASIGATIPTGNLDALPYTGTNDGTENKSVFYLWPTMLDAAQNKTVISIEGIFNGEKQIYHVKPTIDMNIKGNYRYTLKAKREAVNKIDFDIVVDDWNEGGDVTGEINQTVTTFGELTNPSLAGGVFDDTMDGTTVNFDGSDATGSAVLKMTTTSWRSDATEAIVDALNGTASAGTDITVTKTESITYGGAKYNETYTITIPKQSLPVERKISIIDILHPSRKKEIIIKANFNYDNTAFKPVLVGGKYWAPVNVGATKIDATTYDLASCGYLYQWGRNYGSVWGATGDTITGPVSLADANGKYATKFIKNSVTTHDWLDDSSTQEEKNALWSGANDRGPCPVGWRLPTKEELLIISTSWSAEKVDAIAHRFAIPGDISGETLFLPAAGHRRSSNGGYYQEKTVGNYWSSSVYGSFVWMLYINPGGSNSDAHARTMGFSVRCIQK